MDILYKTNNVTASSMYIYIYIYMSMNVFYLAYMYFICGIFNICTYVAQHVSQVFWVFGRRPQRVCCCLFAFYLRCIYFVHLHSALMDRFAPFESFGCKGKGWVCFQKSMTIQPRVVEVIYLSAEVGHEVQIKRLIQGCPISQN